MTSHATSRTPSSPSTRWWWLCWRAGRRRRRPLARRRTVCGVVLWCWPVCWGSTCAVWFRWLPRFCWSVRPTTHGWSGSTASTESPLRRHPGGWSRLETLPIPVEGKNIVWILNLQETWHIFLFFFEKSAKGSVDMKSEGVWNFWLSGVKILCHLPSNPFGRWWVRWNFLKKDLSKVKLWVI